MAVADAAERLGVSVRQVQHLVARGELRPLARGVVDRSSVDRLVRSRQGSRTRAWAEATAWGAISLLSGGDAAWMGDVQRSRLRSRLRSMDAGELVGRARNRAFVTQYRAHASAAQRLRGLLVSPADASARLGLVDSDVADGYLAAADIDNVVGTFRLVCDDAGAVILRATTIDLTIVRSLADQALVVAGLDAAVSADAREQRAGIDALTDALEMFHG